MSGARRAPRTERPPALFGSLPPATATLPLFVHGTWTTGEEDAPLLRDLPRRGASAPGALYALPSGRSALVSGETGRVHGELVEGPSERLLHLVDLVEGVASGRTRRELVDVLVGLRRVRAWVHLTEVAVARTGRRLPDGRWHPTRRRGVR